MGLRPYPAMGLRKGLHTSVDGKERGKDLGVGRIRASSIMREG